MDRTLAPGNSIVSSSRLHIEDTAHLDEYGVDQPLEYGASDLFYPCHIDILDQEHPNE